MKKLISVFLVVIIGVVFASCDTAVKIVIDDVSSLGDELVSKLTFGDELDKSAAEYTLKKYGINGELVVDCARYAGSGATADEVAVMKCKDENSLNKVKESISDRIQYLHDGYSDYGPEEVPKIDNAKVLTYGNVIVFVIAEDSDNTEQIIKDFYVK